VAGRANGVNTGTVSATPQDGPMLLRTLLAWIIFFGFGAFSYWYLARILDFPELVATICTVLLTITFVGFDAPTARKRWGWAWRLIPYVFALFVYSAVLRSLVTLGQNPTVELRHRFGVRIIGFFVLIFVWILIAPVAHRSEPSVRLRRLQSAVAVVAALVLFVLAVQFLSALWSGTSIDQLLPSMRRTLIHTGLALYLFLVAKILLPKTVSHQFHLAV
jgi:hypothetical protein